MQFLLDLWQQYHQKPSNECHDLFDILSDLEQAEQQFIIVLNNLDFMGNTDVDAQFNQGFYERLNSLKNYRNASTPKQYLEIDNNRLARHRQLARSLGENANLPRNAKSTT